MAKKTNFGSNLSRFFPETAAVDAPAETISVSETGIGQEVGDGIGEQTEQVPAAAQAEAIAGKAKDYRINLRIPLELKEYLDQASWAGHMTVTRYLNELILRDRDATRNGE